jgi:5-methylcytosine-specific restriction endonuclease McrA
MIRRQTRNCEFKGIKKKLPQIRKKFSSFEKNKIAFEQDWKCKCCGDLLHYTFEIDHILPISCNGSNDRINLQALNPKCHRIKTRNEQKQVKKFIIANLRAEDYYETCYYCLNDFIINSHICQNIK